MAKKEKQPKKPNYRLIRYIVCFFSIILSILPITIFVIFRWDEYVQTVEDSIKLSVGCLMAIVLVIMAITGRMKTPPNVVSFGIFFVLSYLLSSVIQDITILCGLAFIGAIIGGLFDIWMKHLKTKEVVDMTATETTRQIKEVVQEVLSGRV